MEHKPLVSMECADAVLDACAEAMLLGVPVPHPTDFLERCPVPECLKGFTREEVAEATNFLFRIGELTFEDGKGIL